MVTYERRRQYCRNYRKYKHENAERCKNRWRQANIQKFRAQHIASRLVPLDSKCADCHITETLERHHPDYSKPLVVVTLCKICHEARHNAGETGVLPFDSGPEIRYLDGWHRVEVLVKGHVEGCQDKRLWRVRLESNEEVDVYPARLQLFEGKYTKARGKRLLTK